MTGSGVPTFITGGRRTARADHAGKAIRTNRATGEIPIQIMKKLAPIFLSVAITSAVFIGCDFVDSNNTYVESEEPTVMEPRFNGYFATEVDTTGNEDPEDMPPTPPNP